jgi:hypothetical protein
MSVNHAGPPEAVRESDDISRKKKEETLVLVMITTMWAGWMLTL